MNMPARPEGGLEPTPGERAPAARPGPEPPPPGLPLVKERRGGEGMGMGAVVMGGARPGTVVPGEAPAGGDHPRGLSAPDSCGGLNVPSMRLRGLGVGRVGSRQAAVQD